MRELLATLTLVVFVVVLSVVLVSSSSSDDYDDYDDDDETTISAGRLQYHSQRGGRNAPDRLTVALYAEEEDVTNEPSRSAMSIPPVHMRWNPEWTFNHNAHANENDGCHAGALCVGPGRLYPIGRQVLGVPTVTGSFVVPPLPLSFDPINTTYYDYLNIFWRTNPLPGFMNQFVPQLMLGNALANSTNHPHYEPQWIPLHQWHIGAQYFMAICPPVSSSTDNDTYRDDKDRDDKDVSNTMTNQSTTTQDDHAGSHYHHRQYDCDHWIAKAATGKLIAVEPGEGIFTSFELVTKTSHTKKDSDANNENNNNNNHHHHHPHDNDNDNENDNDNDGDDFEWHLTMGVIGADDSRISHLVVPKPFMGLIDAYNNKSTTSSWMDEVYEQVYVGSCLENYGMHRRENYPSYWDLDVEIVQEPPRTNSTSSQRETGTATSSSSSSWIWQDWKLEHDKTCDWQPDSQVSSRSGNGYQTASWRAWLHPPQPKPKRSEEGSYFGEKPDSTVME